MSFVVHDPLAYLVAGSCGFLYSWVDLPGTFPTDPSPQVPAIDSWNPLQVTAPAVASIAWKMLFGGGETFAVSPLVIAR
jgi:hypothetical protein